MPETSPRPDVPTSTLPAPQPTHPVAGRAVTEEAPEFRWTSVPDASGYRLQLAGSADFDSCYYDEPVDRPAAVTLEEVLPDEAETVFWRVRAASEDEAPWSNPATFTVTETESDPDAQFLVDAPPVPIRPVRGDAVDTEAATLTWEGVPEAGGYRVQVASAPDFAEALIDLTLDQTTTLTLFDELPSERQSLYWRVRALFPNDTEGPWSEINRFGTDPDIEEDVSADEAPADEPADTLPPERSPRAAGPAGEARTSGVEALVGIGVFVVSFLLTILLIMMV